MMPNVSTGKLGRGGSRPAGAGSRRLSGKDLTPIEVQKTPKFLPAFLDSGFAAFCQAIRVPKADLPSKAATGPQILRGSGRYRGSRDTAVTMDRWEGIRLSWNLPDRGIWEVVAGLVLEAADWLGSKGSDQSARALAGSGRTSRTHPERPASKARRACCATA